jgi:hypothetical protein
MKSLIEVKRKIDSVPRPVGYNPYAWAIAKKVALEVWECYLAGRPYGRQVNYFHKSFYDLLRKANGELILPCK